MEEIGVFDAIDVDHVEAEMGLGTTKDLTLEDIDVTGSTTEDDNDGDGNGGNDGCSDDNRAINDLF